VIPSLLGALAVTAPVVMLVQNLLAGIHPVGDQRAILVAQTVSRHPATTNVVGRPRGRAHTHLGVVGSLALVRVAVVRARLAAPAGVSHSVEGVPNRGRRNPPVRGRHERLASSLVPYVLPQVLDEIRENLSNATAYDVLAVLLPPFFSGVSGGRWTK